MGIPEPSSPLWTAVKAIYDSWPPDDEAAAARLADAWQLAVDTVTTSAEETGRARDGACAAWQDDGGAELGLRVDQYLAELAGLGQRMARLQVRADHYRQELHSAKTAIVDNITQNEVVYALLANPVMIRGFGPGVDLRHDFATTIANHLRDMIMRKAAALRWDGAAPPPVNREPVLAFGHYAHTALDVAGLVVDTADLANAVWYLAEGEYGEAARSALGAVPVAGMGATAAKVAQVADAVGDAVPPEGADGRPDDTIEFAGRSWMRVQEPDGSYTLYLNAETYPESARHVQDAQLTGHPQTVTVDNRPPHAQQRAENRRKESLANFRREYRQEHGVPYRNTPGPDGRPRDLDEYPPARMWEGGKRNAGTPDEAYASVRPIDASDNRGSGSSWWNHGVRGLPEDAKVNVVVVPDTTP
ncbi:hypothetical protein LZG04_24825 [Saccharothrix sp. S26]|uniref:WXG100-like domain-containing protein n=1 Tax=Saccharothrix sp. S26 TaxID=2907215 RepID=UPI001F489A5B|nr:hypothetical protein [Saccharothrix sp. S26]MCE6997997.1 hypothetical protein [Saccharothrix sp. S26]